MATVLFVWELGAGMGHLVNLLPLAKGLSERGHKVVAVLRDLVRVESIFHGINIQYFQAPIFIHAPLHPIEPIRTFAHVLYNNGFSDFGETQVLARAWRNLYAYIKPDLIFFDHSPLALLAARGWDAKKALIGTGFFTPLDQYPLPDLRPWLGDAGNELKQDEDKVCDLANRVLELFDEKPLRQLSGLYYDQIDINFLATYPELDHYGRRPGGTYYGTWPNVGGKAPIWPDASGKRIFAYLKPFLALPQLLMALRESGLPIIVHGDGFSPKIIEQFQTKTLHFEQERLDMSEVSRQCDAAILNGNHGTTVSMLLAGRPTLQIPLFLEQRLFAQAVERLGAGIVVQASQPQQMNMQLNELLQFAAYTQAAKEFARCYADFDSQRQIEAILQRVEELLS
jgi:hypothetical protein